MGIPKQCYIIQSHSFDPRIPTTYLYWSTSFVPYHHKGDHYMLRFGHCLPLPLNLGRSTSDPCCTAATNLASACRLLAISPTTRTRPSSPERSWLPRVGPLLSRELFLYRSSLRVSVYRLCLRRQPSPIRTLGYPSWKNSRRAAARTQLWKFAATPKLGPAVSSLLKKLMGPLSLSLPLTLKRRNIVNSLFGPNKELTGPKVGLTSASLTFNYFQP